MERTFEPRMHPEQTLRHDEIDMFISSLIGQSNKTKCIVDEKAIDSVRSFLSNMICIEEKQSTIEKDGISFYQYRTDIVFSTNGWKYSFIHFGETNNEYIIDLIKEIDEAMKIW